MKRSGRKQEWSLTLFTFGVVLFLPPVISIYDRSWMVMGIPVAYLVLFSVWTFLIFAIYLGARPSHLRKDANVKAQAIEPTFPDTDHRERS